MREPELEPGFHLNYPGLLFCELPGFFRFGSNPGSIPSTHLFTIYINVTTVVDVKNRSGGTFRTTTLVRLMPLPLKAIIYSLRFCGCIH